MLSAVIAADRRYPAMFLVEPQLNELAGPHGATASLRPTYVAVRPVGLSVRLLSAVTLQSASTDRAEGALRAPPLLFRRRRPQSNCPPATVRMRVCLRP